MQTFTKSPVHGQPLSADGGLNLKIAGFSQQDRIPIADIVAAIDVLPSFQLAGLREIVYAPDWPRPSLSRFGSAYAQFIQRERKIVFYKLGSIELFRHVLYHEIGHFVYFLAISSKVKKLWVTEIFPRSDAVSAYGEQSASEDFAETYAFYVHDPKALSKMPEKEAFMRDCVFSGRPETLKEKSGAVLSQVTKRPNRVNFSA
jgi:hypothetical protein